MLDYNDPRIKGYDKLLCYQQFEVIVTGTNHPLDFLWIVYKPIVICPHAQMKIYSLCR
jgi:hypothetical protein